MRGALALLVLCVASTAAAREINNNVNVGTGTPVVPSALTYWNGSRWVAWDGNPVLGSTSTVLFSSTVAAATSTSLTAFTPLTAANIYGDKLVRIATTGFAAAAPWRVKFVGSQDGITYSYLMNRSSSAAGPDSWTDTDTLMVRGHGNTIGTLVTGGSWWPMAFRNAIVPTPKFIGMIFSSDSSAGATGTVTVEIQGVKK
jgi:hypothetical protein